VKNSPYNIFYASSRLRLLCA